VPVADIVRTHLSIGRAFPFRRACPDSATCRSRSGSGLLRPDPRRPCGQDGHNSR